MRGYENREKQTAGNCGGKGQPGRDGHGESVAATHSCSVQSEMLNEAHAKKKQNKTKKKYIYIYLTRYSPISRQAGINFLPSLVPCTGSEKSLSPDILTSPQI